jgi:hypothetical protein
MSERLRAGDWVEVKSREEILATLDGDGSLGALPFMPEMLQYSGKRFRVYKSAHKTCTPPQVIIRRMEDAVHLEGLRCDGAAHDGCQAGCLLFFKNAWLRRVGEGDPARAAAPLPADVPELLARASRAPAEADGVERYRCQATELVRATTQGKWWDPSLYLRDLTSRNVGLWDFFRYGVVAALNVGLRILNRREIPFLRPRCTDKTPTARLDLQAGERVNVKTTHEIMGTLDDNQKNRGLRFDVEMTPFCGREATVLRKAEKFIDDRNGRMISPRGTCLILDEVACHGNLSTGRLFCPRNIYAYWHEVWLERPGDPAASASPEL